jgi:hypothetical protein
MPFGQPRAELVAIAMLRTPDDTFANSTVYHRVAFTQNHDRYVGLFLYIGHSWTLHPDRPHNSMKPLASPTGFEPVLPP